MFTRNQAWVSKAGRGRWQISYQHCQHLLRPLPLISIHLLIRYKNCQMIETLSSTMLILVMWMFTCIKGMLKRCLREKNYQQLLSLIWNCILAIKVLVYMFWIKKSEMVIDIKFNFLSMFIMCMLYRWFLR